MACSLVPISPQLLSLAVQITQSIIRTASDNSCGGGLGMWLCGVWIVVLQHLCGEQLSSVGVAGGHGSWVGVACGWVWHVGSCGMSLDNRHNSYKCIL